MPDVSPSLLILIVFTFALFTLFWLSQQISRYLQLLVYALTHSVEFTTLVLFLVFLPGIVVHESAHWLVARLLGLKTGKFRVWPKVQGGVIRLGSVAVQDAGVWLNSLVGVAPLLIGSILITFIGLRFFNSYQIAAALTRGEWASGFSAFWSALRGPDGLLWAYLLFALANAMMPSPADREPFGSVLLYTGATAALYVLLGLPTGPLASALAWVAPLVEDLTSALIFVILLDVGVLLFLIVPTLFLPRQTG